MLSNVKVAHIRPRYNNLKEWMEDPNNFYIGRPGVVFVTVDNKNIRWPPTNSNLTHEFIFANKEKLSKNSELSDFEKYLKALKAFEIQLKESLSKKENLEAFLSLKGKNLGCWCVHSQREFVDYEKITEDEFKEKGLCHGDVILKVLASYV